MNGPIDAERILDAYLAPDADRLPDRVIDAALADIARTPQRRALRVPWRFQNMSALTRATGIGAALLVAAIAGGGLIYLSSKNPGVGGAPTASATPIDLSSRFRSTRYGYSISISAGWTTTPATATWVGPDNSAPAVDQIRVNGTDTTISGASQQLAPGQTFNEWLVPFHANGVANLPPECNGGDPSRWPAVTVGTMQGRWEQLCNAAEALVVVEGRVYVFSWGNSTFFGDQHLSVDQFRQVLATVTFEGVP